MSQLHIGTLRQASVFMRSIASIVLISFCTVTLSPGARAIAATVENAQATSNAQAQILDDQKHNFGKALDAAKQHLRVMAGKPDVFGKQPTAADRAGKKAALREWRKELQRLDSETRADFDSIAAMIANKKLSDVIKARHAEALAKYKSEMTALNADLDGALNATDNAVAQAKAEAAFNRLNNTKLERAHQEFDPNNLPNSSLKPNRDRKPKLTAQEFITAGLMDNPTVRLATIQPFNISGMPSAQDPAYRAATTEVVLTPDIVAKANELDGNPVKIYNWVRNNVQWQPTWGAIQDASHTLSSQRGNAFDIASLTIALLRASGIPARYVHGVIEVPEAQFRNWAGGFQNIDAAIDFASAGGILITSVISGGKVTKIRLEHIWVEAAVDYAPSRGAVNKSPDTWVAMDPSFKQLQILPGLNAVQISGIDPTQLANNFLASGTVNEAEGWAAGLNPTILRNAQTQAQAALQDYINTNLPNATVGDVLGGRKIVTVNSPVLPASLPNRIAFTGPRYATVPNALEQQITFAFGKDIEGFPIDPHTFPWAQLNNKQVTLSFRPAMQADEDALKALLPIGGITDVNQLPTSIPAYLIHVVPELKAQGEVLLAGSAMQLGNDIEFVFNPRFVSDGEKQFSYKLPAGAYVAIAVVAESISARQLLESQQRLSDVKDALDARQADTLSGESFFGRTYAAGLLSYYAQYAIAGEKLGKHYSAYHSIAAGIGSFGYEPSVKYVFGIPTRIYGGAAVMNMPIVNIVGADMTTQVAKKAFTMELGMLSSALEFGVPYQLLTSAGLTSSGVSASAALQKALSLGQRLYHITPENQAAVLPLIHHDSGTMVEIEQALSAGKEVFTHSDPVSVTGWSGSGYVITDPDSGAGAYKISGGQNGGLAAYIFAWVVLTAALTALAIFATLLLTEGAVFALPAILSAVNVVSFIQALYTFEGTALTVYAPWKAALGVLLSALPFFGVPAGLENDAKAFQWFLSGMNTLIQCISLPGPFGICGPL
jgi:hypothetical protein